MWRQKKTWRTTYNVHLKTHRALVWTKLIWFQPVFKFSLECGAFSHGERYAVANWENRLWKGGATVGHVTVSSDYRWSALSWLKLKNSILLLATSTFWQTTVWHWKRKLNKITTFFFFLRFCQKQTGIFILFYDIPLLFILYGISGCSRFVLSLFLDFFFFQEFAGLHNKFKIMFIVVGVSWSIILFCFLSC